MPQLLGGAGADAASWLVSAGLLGKKTRSGRIWPEKETIDIGEGIFHKGV
jgi:hypothetical protein